MRKRLWNRNKFPDSLKQGSEIPEQIADETVVPLGFGRDIASPGTFQDMLRDGLIDLLRPNVTTHGISGIRRLAANA